jgi:hypothetical protein
MLRSLGLEPPIDARWWCRAGAHVCLVVFVVLGLLSLTGTGTDRAAWVVLALWLVLSGAALLFAQPAPGETQSRDGDRWLGTALVVIGIAEGIVQFPRAPIVYALIFVLGWLAVLCIAARFLRWRWPLRSHRG